MLYKQQMAGQHPSWLRPFYLYTDWQKKRYNRNQSCFIQAVISSNYVEINKQKLLAVSCFEGCMMDELGFYVPSTVFQSFRDDGRVNMKGSVQWSAV